MEITFLLGNGLDLNCGCKSSYRDIYDYYLTQPSPNEWVKRLKNTISKDIETWGDFEMEMAKYVSTCKDEEEAMSCIRDFVYYMDEFLTAENRRLSAKIKEEEDFNSAVSEEIKRAIVYFYRYCTPNVSRLVDDRLHYSIRHYNFVSFNYTYFLDSLLEKVSYEYSSEMNSAIGCDYSFATSFIHIHGTINNNEVVGVDNTRQFGKLSLNPSFLERAFIKPCLNNRVDLNRVEEASKSIEKADVICVFGMSLGDSDATWRDKIANWLQADENHHLFYYNYEYSGRTKLSVPERLDEEENAVKLFRKKLEMESEQYNSQIHIPIGANLFNIQMCIENNQYIKYQTIMKRNAIIANTKK